MRQIFKDLYNRIIRYFLKETEPLSQFQEASMRLQLLTFDERKVYRDIRRIEVLENSIETYTARIKTAILALHEDIGFPKEPLSLRVVKVCNFYRRENGLFLDTKRAHREFIKVASEFILLYELKDLTRPQSGKLQSNLYRSRVIANNIIALSRQLSEK